MADNNPFTRTTCACDECRACCKRQPGPLAPGDLERIAAYLGQPPEAVRVHFWASPGARVMNTATGRQYQIGSITPRRGEHGCVFLDVHERCTIHPVAPFGCAYFDTHMDVVEGQSRGTWLVRQQMASSYQSLRALLATATSYAPTRY